MWCICNCSFQRVLLTANVSVPLVFFDAQPQPKQIVIKQREWITYLVLFHARVHEVQPCHAFVPNHMHANSRSIATANEAN